MPDELNRDLVQRVDRLVVASLDLSATVFVETLSIGSNISRAIAPVDSFKEIVRAAKTRSSEAFIGACVLRLLGTQAVHWLGTPPWRAVVVEFIEGLYGDRLYGKRKADGLQSHQKIDELAKVAADAERQLGSAISTLTNLDRIDKHRQAVLAALNGLAGQAVILPFLLPDLQTHLTELYQRSKDYWAHRESPLGLDAHSRAQNEAMELARSLTLLDSQYARLLTDGVCTKLRKMLRQDLGSNPATQATDLSFEQQDKKYPLHETKRELTVTLLIRNTGLGYAHDVRISVSAGKALKVGADVIDIGRLGPGGTYPISVNCVVTSPAESATIECYAEWRDFDGTRRELLQELALSAQNPNIDWASLASHEPYSLEPVTSERDLIGRRDTLDRIYACIDAKNSGSAIIQGQKRVGKTSIAKALQSRLESEGGIVIYLEAGDYVEPDGRKTITRLGQRICREIRKADQRFANSSQPVFSEALSPLVDFLDDVIAIAPGRRITVILDEFDQLPLELYSRGELADAFFLTLRSITSRSQVSFVVVGGERMKHVVDGQGQHLNKWKSFPVDYFHRETDWADYSDLIQRPVVGTLEFSSGALAGLYETTSGNPYFTNLICQQIFHLAIARREASITLAEVNTAIREAVSNSDANTFQHFWDDGIMATGTASVEKSVRRRRVLIAVSDTLRKRQPAPRSDVLSQPLVSDVTGADFELREFVTRKVLVGEDAYDFKVPLFHSWLASRGVSDVITSFEDIDAAARARQQEAELQIRSDEIVSLVKAWPNYRGQVITEDRVRSWLAQFGGVREQRMMFKVLQHLRFFSNSFVRSKMSEIEAIVDRKVIKRVNSDRRKRDDVLVSYLDGAGKSGSAFASLYADETGLYVQNVVEKGRLNEKLLANDSLRATVFIDDFVGTGDSACTQLQELASELKKVPQSSSLVIVYAVVAAFKSGWQRVQDTASSLGIHVEPHCCVLLDNADQCFSDSSATFQDSDERSRARDIVFRQGKLLEKKWPLGFGDVAATVVFETGCPNNSLPVLWSESNNPPWLPLFRRL